MIQSEHIYSKTGAVVVATLGFFTTTSSSYALGARLDTMAVGTPSPELNYFLQQIINGLSAAAALVMVLSLIFSGIQFMTARDNASQVAAAKQRILVTVLTLVLFIFGYAILQWLVPGGIF